jgi:stage V sporulation protein AE
VTGVIEDVNKRGFLGIFTGGLTSAAAGITAAVVFGYLMAVLFNPKSK